MFASLRRQRARVNTVDFRIAGIVIGMKLLSRNTINFARVRRLTIED
jgi:predicted nucleic acid-binding protein